MAAILDWLRGPRILATCAEARHVAPPSCSFFALLPAVIRDQVDRLLAISAWRYGDAMLRHAFTLPLTFRVERITLSSEREMLAFWHSSPLFGGDTTLAFVDQLQDPTTYHVLPGRFVRLLAQRDADGSPLILTCDRSASTCYVYVVSVSTGKANLVSQSPGRPYEYTSDVSLKRSSLSPWLDLGDSVRRLPALTDPLPLGQFSTRSDCRRFYQGVESDITVCGSEAERLIVQPCAPYPGTVAVWDLRQATEIICWHKVEAAEVFPDLGVVLLQTSQHNAIIYTLATGAQRSLALASPMRWALAWDRRIYIAHPAEDPLRSPFMRMARLDLGTEELIVDHLQPAPTQPSLRGPLILCISASNQRSLVHLPTGRHLCTDSSLVAAWLHSDCLFSMHDRSTVLHQEVSLVAIDLTAAPQRTRTLLTYTYSRAGMQPILLLLPPSALDVHGPLAVQYNKQVNVYVLPPAPMGRRSE